jgi:hypothetical protein
MVPARRHHKAPIKIWFDPETHCERAIEAARAACILGETVDISRTGFGFVVSFIRLKEKYLVGQERMLNVEIDLPNGKVFLRAIGRRYEKVGQHVSTERFLVGVQITSLVGQDRETYETFLKNGNRGMKGATRQLGLGID